MLPQYTLLSKNIRCGLEEEEHYGLICLYNKKFGFKKIGEDNNYLFSLRSCMKPFQFAAVSEIADYYNLSDMEIAVASASHVGEKQHTDLVLSILKKTGVDEKYLLCPSQEPLSIKAQKELIKNNMLPSKIHNNCSGKHAAILAYCKLKGFDLEDYNQVSHPVQQKILNFCQDIFDVSEKNCKITQDGCTLPVLAIPAENTAKGFLKFFTDKTFERITRAIVQNPYIFGGYGRLDSELVYAGNGKLAAKVGAGNICVVVDRRTETSVFIKISDGGNYSRAVILTNFLKEKRILADEEYFHLKKIFPTEIKDEKGSVLGNVEFFM